MDTSTKKRRTSQGGIDPLRRRSKQFPELTLLDSFEQDLAETTAFDLLDRMRRIGFRFILDTPKGSHELSPVVAASIFVNCDPEGGKL